MKPLPKVTLTKGGAFSNPKVFLGNIGIGEIRNQGDDTKALIEFLTDTYTYHTISIPCAGFSFDRIKKLIRKWLAEEVFTTKSKATKVLPFEGFRGWLPGPPPAANLLYWCVLPDNPKRPTLVDGDLPIARTALAYTDLTVPESPFKDLP